MPGHTQTLDNVMSTPVWSIQPETTVLEALAVAKEHDVDHLPVLVGGTPVGVVCTCDLQDCELTQPASSALHRRPETIPASATCVEAARHMDAQEVGSLLVVDDGRVLGIVTRADLAQAGVRLPKDSHLRCAYCGSIDHLRHDDARGAICMDCLLRAEPASGDDELGGGGGGD